jgi:hypothetical protein
MNSMKSAPGYMHDLQIDSRHRIVTRLRWTAHDQTATAASLNRHMDLFRPIDDHLHRIMASNARNHISDLCHLRPCPTPKHPRINHTSHLVIRQLTTQLHTCLLHLRQSYPPECTLRNIHMLKFDTHQVPPCMKERPVGIPWHLECLSNGWATQSRQ